jgi:hypothetical protein
MIEFNKWGKISSRREHQGGSARLSYTDQSILRSHIEGKEEVDAKTLAQDDRFYPSCGKRVKESSARQRRPTESFVPSCLILRKVGILK